MVGWYRLQHDVMSLIRTANSALSEMFDDYTVNEWIEQKVYPLYDKLDHIRREADQLRTVKYWPARPYNTLEDIKELVHGDRDKQQDANNRT